MTAGQQRVLDAFSELERTAQHHVSLREVSAHLGLNKVTVLEHVRKLVGHGLMHDHGEHLGYSTAAICPVCERPLD